MLGEESDSVSDFLTYKGQPPWLENKSVWLGYGLAHRIDLFDCVVQHSLHTQALRRKKLQLWILLPFMVMTLAACPIVLPLSAFQGKHGALHQTVCVVIAAQLVLQYVILAIELFSSKIRAWFLLDDDTPGQLREWVMMAYVLISPVGHGGILLAKSISEICPPDVSILEANFCRVHVDYRVPAENYVAMLIYSVFYQILLPLNWRYHLISSLIGLSFLVATMVATLARAGSLSSREICNDALYLACFVLCVIAQLQFQKKRVNKFIQSTQQRQGASDSGSISGLDSAVRLGDAEGGGGGGGVRGGDQDQDQDQDQAHASLSSSSSLPPPAPVGIVRTSSYSRSQQRGGWPPVRSTGSDWSEEENSNNGAPYNNRTFSFMAVRDSPAPPHLHPDMNMYWDNVRQEAVCTDTFQSDDISELTMMTDEDATVQLAQ